MKCPYCGREVTPDGNKCPKCKAAILKKEIKTDPVSPIENNKEVK
jgi:tRNA(Ile2) C34 agmatinyltransferase TiaS